MRPLFIVLLVPALSVAACGQAADGPSALASPAAPTAVVRSDSQAASAPAAKTVEVPFHSEITWTKVPGEPDLARACTGSRQPG